MPAEGNANGTGSLENNIRSSSATLPLQISPGHHHTNSSHHCDPEYARMESWLDEHPDFSQNYFMRKASRNVVDSWLVSHTTPGSLPGNDMMSMLVSSPTHVNQSTSRSGSGATTPVRWAITKSKFTHLKFWRWKINVDRKISAHEFERGGLLKPIVNTIDGTPTFLSITSENQSTLASPNLNGTSSIIRPQRLSRNELKQLDEKELIFELVNGFHCNSVRFHFN